jgi:transaldolase
MAEPAGLGIKIFADGADVSNILELADNPLIAGFTTNPTLMRKAGVDDYESFARKVLDHITDRPVSFEVFSDDFDDMRRQAHLIASWGDNVFVKIPVTNTHGLSAAPLVADLTADGLALNVTALLSLDQVRTIAGALAASPGAVVSVFAGRIADTGAHVGQPSRDPERGPGRVRRLPHHHVDRRPDGEVGRPRARSGRRIARHRADVPP